MRLVALILIFLTGAAMAQDQRELRVVWNEGIAAYQSGDFAGFRAAMVELAAQRPSQYPIMYNVAVGHALVGDTSAAMVQLERIAAQGLYIPLLGDEDFAQLESNPAYIEVRSQITANNRPLGESRLVLEVDAEGLLAEGVAINTENDQIFVSSVRAGTIFRTGEGDSFDEFVTAETDHGLAGIFGMTIDHARNMLWAVSALGDPYRGANRSAEPRSALFGFDLDTGDVRVRAPVPGRDLAFLGEVVLSPDGEVYVSDSGTAAIYRLNEERNSLEAVVRDHALTNLQGFAFAPDGRMYIADYAMGLFIFDPATGITAPLSVPFTINATGIDGLYFYDGDLIGVQNGLRPYRIVRFNLTSDGTGVNAATVLARNLEGWDEPTLGQIVGHQLIYNAASGWPQFGANGEPLGDAELPPVRIMALDLN